MPYLIMSKKSSGYKVFSFSDRIRIGREENNDIILNEIGDKAISRHHATIDQQKEAYVLFDQSSNGTLVNNKPIKKYTLAHGDSFQILDYAFAFIDETATTTIAQKSSPNFTKPLDIKDKFDESVATITIIKKPGHTPTRKINLKECLRKENIIVESETMLSLFMDIVEVAKINVPVLITGESGTGKEKVAQALHLFSNMEGAFIPLNCSSIPEGIFESELFGSVKGAFHNAGDKPGKLELAEDGTIFLDEVGDMNLSLQPKLLRFLEDKKISRLGDTKIKPINVRVIAATNQDLKTMIGEKKFREDFYQRLACVKLAIPPLRERKDDIPPLTDFFLSRFSKEHNLKASRISDKAKIMLLDYHWPGNVRELGNILLNAIVRNRGKIIEPDHLLAASEIVQTPEPGPSETFLSLQDMEKMHVKEALERTGWNKVDAAKLLGMSRDTIYKKIRKYNIT